MYKVFFKDRILFLTDKLELDLSHDFDALHKFTSHHELKLFLESFEQNNQLTKGFLYGRSAEQLLSELKKCYRFITAAGGLVENQHQQLLFIHRLGVYDLPKGKSEKDESFEQTALREVREECGIDQLKIRQLLGSTFHTYIQKDIHYLKQTVWYSMDYSGTGRLRPQTEEQITHAEWLDKTQLRKVTQNTYPSILSVLAAGKIIES